MTPPSPAPGRAATTVRPTLNVGLIGCGTVGLSVARALRTSAARLTDRLGADVHLARIADRHPDRVRAAIGGVAVGDDPLALLHDRTIDVLIETSGDLAAADWIATALDRGTPVISTNKLAIASSLSLLSVVAARHPLFHCEGAVAAAIPLVRALRDSLDGDEIHEIRGILNGTTTFILSAVERGIAWRVAVDRAIALGFAEGSGEADLSGRDASAKLAVLATLAWRTPLTIDRVRCRGLDLRSESAAREAAQRGQRLRLVAEGWRDPAPRLLVEPRALELSDPLARADDVSNAIELRASLGGNLSWFGPGAGGDKTASAVLGDLIAAVQSLRVSARSAAA